MRERDVTSWYTPQMVTMSTPKIFLGKLSFILDLGLDSQVIQKNFQTDAFLKKITF